MEIDSRVPVFEKFNSFGQSLLDERHSNSEEIDEKLKEVQASRQNLERYEFICVAIALYSDILKFYAI